MSDITKTAGPNETTDELEEQRKSSIKDAFGGSSPSEEETETSEEEEKSEEKLDNDQDNAYINNKDESEEDKPTDEETPEEKYERIFKKQFNEDGIKAAKSWAQTQKSFVEMREKLKEQQNITQNLEQIVNKNPKLEKILRTASEKGELTDEDLQSFLQSDREPSGKPNTSSKESKLEVVDNELNLDSVEDETLAQEGLLDLSKKELMTDSEWETARRQAAIKYAEKTMPSRIANKALKTFEQQIEDKREQEEQKKQKQKEADLNNKRYRKGVNRVIDEFGLDFAGNEKHQEALDEIEKRASTIRDHENPNVIRPNAIYLATLEMIEEGKLDVDKAEDVDQTAKQAKQDAEADLEDKMGFNKSASSSKNVEGDPDSITGKLRQRNLNRYEEEIEKRRKTDRLHKKDS